jgi:NAD(P)-dependent dehydrogenase (short-subunit alcohol dehydrogenase family)
MALNFQGKTALVTGGGSGICLELTKRLLSGGCNVLIADLVLQPEVQKDLETIGGNAKASYVKTDVTNWTALQKAFDTALEKFGRLDIVVPGAGIFEPVSSLHSSGGASH